MEGRSAVFWLELFPNCKLTCIDKFPEMAEVRFDANVARYGSRVIKIKSRSATALDALRHNSAPVDLAYIDGDHHMHAVLADPLSPFR